MTPDSLEGVFAVPPLARKPGTARAIDFEQNSRDRALHRKRRGHTLDLWRQCFPLPFDAG